MRTTSVFVTHDFDPAMVEQLDSIRMIRLQMAEQMLRNVPETLKELTARGLIDEADKAAEAELVKELTEKIDSLKARIGSPEMVHADEITFYVDLLEAEGDLDDVTVD